MAPKPASRPARRPARGDQLGNLVTSGLLLVAFGIGLAGLYRVLDGIGWWWQALAVVAITLGAAAAGRSLARHPAWGSLVGAVAAFLTIVVMFAADEALLFFIPTGDTFEALRALEEAGAQSIAEQDVPAQATTGIAFLLCFGVAALAVLADLLAIGTRMPALSALPLGILVIVPSLVRPAFSDAGIFALVAVVFVGILLVRAKRIGWRGTLGLAGAAIVTALVAPVVLPPVIPGTATTTGSGLSTGLNPIVTLGDDLRRGNPELALTYQTSTDSAEYLRLAVLDDFTGVSWRPTATEVPQGNTIDAIPDPPGLTADVPRSELITNVEVGNVLSRWLPVPYSPKSVTGLDDSWAWEPDGFGIRSERSNARDQVYEVVSLRIQPTVEQLLAAGTIVEPGFDRYLQLPPDLPQVVVDTAREVAGGAATHYERAVALQAFFTGGLFTYSEDAPVDDRYDGSGASVLEPFLAARAGYCVHFSSAMAAMARVLGIPARVAVGFTPGNGSALADGRMLYTVTTHDLHAWPELYFADIGWVRFEPTPGRGAAPTFAQATVDDPDTPDVDESVPTPAATSAPTAAPTAAPELPDEQTLGPEAGGAGGTSTGGGLPWLGPVIGAAVVLLLLLPALLRTIRRARRLRAVDAGSAEAGWTEIRDTVVDLGWPVDPGLTPRRFASDLGDLVDDEGRLLERLRGELEVEVFAARPAEPSSDDVADILRSLRRAAGFGRSVIATLAPRTLLPARLAASPSGAPATPAG